MIGKRAAALALVLYALPAMSQTIPVPNPGFEDDPATGSTWVLSGGAGQWQIAGDAGAGHAITVTGTGEDTNYWRSGMLPLEESVLYQLRFTARALTEDGGGTAISGPEFCNRDLGVPPVEGNSYATAFLAPSGPARPDWAWLRFGQWHMTGAVAFDDVSLTHVQAIHQIREGITLGAGESIAGITYAFHGPAGTEFGNYTRPLESHNCAFNTNRWNFAGVSDVTYRHAIDSRKQLSATVEVNVNHHQAGTLSVEAQTPAGDWVRIGEQAGDGSLRVDLPERFFPADAITIRLAGGDHSAAFQVDGYAYTASLDGEPIACHGNTRFLAVPSTDARFHFQCNSLGEARPGGQNVLAATIENRTQSELPLAVALTVTGDDGSAKTVSSELRLGTEPATVELPYEVTSAGGHSLALTIGGPESFRAETSFHVAGLFDSRYGERLPQATDQVGLWWSSSGWKISRDRPIPQEKGTAIVIRAAQNEAEAAQLVLRPAEALEQLTASAGDLSGPDGALLSHENVDVLRVRYVDVAQPTDPTGVAAPWPDPLPPFAAPIDLKAGENQPLWVRVNVPLDAAPGLYEGSIRLEAEGYSAEVPLRVEVYGFALPVRPTCTTAFGFSPGNVYRYHNISDPALQRQVLDMYWQNFSRHRITPYDPAPLDPFVVTWPGVDGWKQGARDHLEHAFTPVIDWTAWDTAMTQAIDGYGFNSFRLSIAGMGGGTFHSRTDPSLLGYAENTPEYQAAFAHYCRAVQEHLREKGWLDEAYVYWFDEPDPKDYEFVMNGFRKISEAAPEINRMLTEQVEPALIGGPNIWCPISDAFSMEDAERRRAEGEKFWWYVCTWPQAPYCTLFIDHPATELRVWLWQTWQRQIDGILVWQSNYWTSSAAYPDVPQNPYADPMGWTSGYSTPAGTKRPWGNGDGRFIYPPEAAADGQQPDPVIAGPVDSIRWEMLRDGVEDYEYLAILREVIDAADKAGTDDAVLKEYRALLEVPAEITASMTEFTTDPAPIEARRDAVARAIMRLRETSG